MVLPRPLNGSAGGEGAEHKTELRDDGGGVNAVHNCGGVAPKDLRVGVPVDGEFGEADPVDGDGAVAFAGLHLLGEGGL